MSYGESWAYSVVEGGPALAGLAAHAADLHLRRARRLLRPRAAAGGDRARLDPARTRRPATSPGGYDIYGPRVPGGRRLALLKPNAVTNVVHDHTSVLATIEAKWNLPALTYRDANAKTVADFLDLDRGGVPGTARRSPSRPPPSPQPRRDAKRRAMRTRAARRCPDRPRHPPGGCCRARPCARTRRASSAAVAAQSLHASRRSATCS